MRKSMVDFTDLEHLCLAILAEDTAAEELKPSAVALQYRDKFAEVLIDEYQDVNFVQESILRLVTKETEAAGNLFMVGDVKQSVYRFRLAEPGLFLGKYRRFTPDGMHGGMRIDLAKKTSGAVLKCLMEQTLCLSKLWVKQLVILTMIKMLN
ncbi:hypothetical protein GCM10020331_080300 [Ectobacillus funiculus]